MVDAYYQIGWTTMSYGYRSVAPRATLDFETKAVHTIEVGVLDQTLSGTSSITIKWWMKTRTQTRLFWTSILMPWKTSMIKPL